MSKLHSERTAFELIHVIVNFGLGSKVLQTAKKHGVMGGTVVLGTGTIHNRLLELLAIADVRKEVVLMVADRPTAVYAIEQLDQKFKFSKPNHGIAFTTPIRGVLGANSLPNSDHYNSGGADRMMYHAITVIVERGNAEDVIDAAAEAGSKGGTIINARGSGIHEVSKVLAMEIEPEKEMVLILSAMESTEAIVASIRSKLKLDEPGNGIIFIQDVVRAYGLVE